MSAPGVESPSTFQTTQRGNAADYLHLMRPTDWLKNLLVLAALVFGSRLTLWTEFRAAASATIAFTFLSAVFLINDALDRVSDRANPLKRHRPVARGTIASGNAMLFGTAPIAEDSPPLFSISGKVGLVLILYAPLQLFTTRVWTRAVL